MPLQSGCFIIYSAKNALLTYCITAEQQTYLGSPATKRGLIGAATHNKPQYKMIGDYFFSLTLYKATAFGYFVYDRFIKELIKVFFTLLLKLQFVDIVKCV